MTSTKTLIIFAHRLAEAAKTHQRYSLFFSGNEKKKEKKSKLFVKTVIPFKGTVQHCYGCSGELEKERETEVIG